MKLADWCLLSNVYKIKYLDSEYKALGCKLLVQTLLSCLYNNKIEVAGTRNVAQSGRALKAIILTKIKTAKLCYPDKTEVIGSNPVTPI